jgi:AraC-like DNA-binding protein
MAAISLPEVKSLTKSDMNSIKINADSGTKAETDKNVLSLNGFSVIERCVHNINSHEFMYLKDHLLIFVLEGSLNIVYGKQILQVNKNEMILLKKATLIQYERSGNHENSNLFDCLTFYLKDDLVRSFLTSTELSISRLNINDKLYTSVEPMDECLQAFAHSLKPYFKNVAKVAPSQLRHKMMELLYDTAVCNQVMFQQILLLQNPVRTDLSDVVELNYATPASIQDLAYLSGRSLSTFKRDFQQVYNLPPATWIREKRLKKAKEMLETTGMSVSEICYSLGFENVSHFSRIFKQYHGAVPTSLRQVL